MEFKRIASAGEIERGRCKVFRVDGAVIALFNADGAFYAVQERCTGDGRSLSEATLIGSAVVCACDKALYYLPTGECVDQPHLKPLAVYRVRVAGNGIEIAAGEDPSNAGAARRDYAMDQPSA